MPARNVFWRTTPFRLALSFGVIYALGVALLLGLVYQQTASYLTRRTDRILTSQAAMFRQAGPEQLPARLSLEARRDPLNGFALYDQTGQHVAGDAALDPSRLPADGTVREFFGLGRYKGVRAMAVPLPWGETLVVARDTGQLTRLRRILMEALVLSGSAIAVLGALGGVVLGLDPLRRIHAMRLASDRIVAGDLATRLPVGRRQDELDALAGIVNAMLAEIERLMVQARTAGESVAHELRTPLTRLRATLEHAGEALTPDDPRRALLERCVAEADGVLARFRALLRIAAVEAKNRSAEIGPVELGPLIDQVAELYQPLAKERGLGFRVEAPPGLQARVDPELFFEALANLVDNAIKFTPPGGWVALKLGSGSAGPVVEVSDNGPGVAASDLPLITQRFYRGGQGANGPGPGGPGAPGPGAPGHGLGLSLVAAVVKMHGFALSFDSSAAGTTARIQLG